MHRLLHDRLACPSCRARYDLRVHEEQNGDVIWGYLQCKSCAVVIPIADGFALFTEPQLHEGQATLEALRVKAASWFGTEDQYRHYMLQKQLRGDLEPYAAFHPFNESTRAFEAVSAIFGAQLQDGDFILDPWSRTGWSAEWLAARFPRQRIIAFWEGDKSVLGYRGYRHWLQNGRKAENLDVIFTHPEHGLPLRDKCISALYTLDSIHRFSLHGFAGECLRVSGERAPLVLAHVHLSNSEPQPWFDRGGTIRHGRDYRTWLDKLLAQDSRTAFIWSEAELFTSGPGGGLPPDSPDTAHYNGLILLAREVGHTQETATPIAADFEKTRFLVNPFFKFYFQRLSVKVERGLYDGMTGSLLDRHPVYFERLPKASIRLDDAAVAFLAHAITGHSLSAGAAALVSTGSDCMRWLQPLIKAELLLPVTVTKQAVSMQRFHCNQHSIETGADLVAGFFASFDDRDDTVIRGADVQFTGTEAGAIVTQMASMMRRRDLGSDSKVGISALKHPLGFAAALAGMLAGAHVMLLDEVASPHLGLRLDLLIHHDGVATAGWNARECLSLGLDGGDAGLLSVLAREHEPASIEMRSVGSVTSWIDERPCIMDAATLLEAAYSMSAAAARNPLTVDRPHTFSSFLSLLIALKNRQPILLTT